MPCESQTLQHVVSGCSAHLQQGRYNWRHDSVLKTIADFIQSCNPELDIYCDINDYPSPSIITGEQLRPDMLIRNNGTVYMLELTVGFETNLKFNYDRKTVKYSNLCDELRKDFDCSFVNLSLSAVGGIATESQSFFNMLHALKVSNKDYLFKNSTRLHIRPKF